MNKIFITQDEKTFQHLQSKGYGQKIGKLFQYETFEALYLLEKGKVKILNKKNEEVTITTILKQKKIDMNSYLVYKDLKDKGYEVKTALKYANTFRVYKKGTKVGENHSIWLVDIFEEKDKISIKEYIGKLRIANTTKKKILLAIIDNDKNITYIESNWKRV